MSPESTVEAGAIAHARLFVAISVPDEVRVVLRQIQEELKTILPRHAAAWTRPKSMHLTLRFLGKVASARIPELSDKLRAAVASTGELALLCERLGCFPDLRFPHVLWAWVHDDADALEKLFHRVDDAVAGFAEPELRISVRR